jgi:hypothetical protein
MALEICGVQYSIKRKRQFNLLIYHINCTRGHLEHAIMYSYCVRVVEVCINFTGPAADMNLIS